MFSILLIEDDETLFNEVRQRLSQWSFEVYGTEDFKDVMGTFVARKPDLVIIDIQLPFFDGFHWCRQIRAHSQVPIIFLSSRDHPSDMVMSMQIGADDFVQKPFHFEVLIAKIQAVLRRAYQYTSEAVPLQKWFDATIHFEKNEIHHPSGVIGLTKNEASILRILLQQKDQIVSREELIQKLWDDERFVSDNTLTVNVNRLRKKLQEIGLGNAIETKIGAGYRAIGGDAV